jgi:hypothetical protein
MATNGLLLRSPQPPISCDGPYTRELSEMEGEYEAWLAAGSPPLGPSAPRTYIAPLSLDAAPLIAVVEIGARPSVTSLIAGLRVPTDDVDISPNSPSVNSPVSIFASDYTPVFNQLDGKKPPLMEPEQPMRQPQLMQWEPTS